MIENIKADRTINSTIKNGSRHEGKLTVPKSMRIDGVFRGSLNVSETLTLGETGELIDVDVNTNDAVIAGKIKGIVIAKNKVTLEKNARVEGDICSKLLVVKEGVVFQGKLDIGREQSQEKPLNQPEKAFAPVKNYSLHLLQKSLRFCFSLQKSPL